LGVFVAYDLNKIFGEKPKDFGVLGTVALNIPKDNFQNTQAFKNYEKYRVLDRIVDKALSEKGNLEADFIKEYQSLNPNHWAVYYKIGAYYYQKAWYKAAEFEFQKATAKEITTLPDKHRIDDYLNKIKRKCK
jgi:hypothetical protein